MVPGKTSKQNPLATVLWLAVLVLLWELGATLVARTKRTPENVLPHLWQILGSVFDNRLVNGRQTAIEIVLTNAGITLWRAAWRLPSSRCGWLRAAGGARAPRPAW